MEAASLQAKTLFIRQEVVGYDSGMDGPSHHVAWPGYGAIFLLKWLTEIQVVLSFSLLEDT